MSYTRGKRGPRISATAKSMMIRSAEFSADGRYRYRLVRIWDPSRMPVAFVMFNPSTADATSDDRTLESCLRLARGWGHGSLYVFNLFALVSTDPREVYRLGREAIGSANDQWLLEAMKIDRVVCAWGGLADMTDWRVREFARFAGPTRTFEALAVTSGGNPKHPLYSRANARLVPFSLESKR